jgi:hypothetical protein
MDHALAAGPILMRSTARFFNEDHGVAADDRRFLQTSPGRMARRFAQNYGAESIAEALEVHSGRDPFGCGAYIEARNKKRRGGCLRRD